MTDHKSNTKTINGEAHRLFHLGYVPVPANTSKKHPPMPWKPFQKTPPSLEQLDGLFAKYPSADGLGILTTGMVVVDVDPLRVGSPNPFLTDPEYAALIASAPAVETPRGGVHLYFRAPAGTRLRNSANALAPNVDIRADGGFLMVPPSVRDGIPYRWRNDKPLDVRLSELPEFPKILADRLAKPARNNRPNRRARVPLSGPINEGERDDTLFRLASKWRGMGHAEPELLALLRLHNQVRCSPELEDPELQKIARSAAKYEPNRTPIAKADHPDPGPLPDRLLTIPGFVADVMAITLSTAPRPNRPLAFVGALTLLATLAGRKVKTASDLRTNIYVIGLGPSGIGKDHPRKVIKQIMFSLGLDDSIIGSIASGQALEDAVVDQPSCLALTDEIDEMLMAIRRDKSGTRQNLPKVLMEFFTSASVVYNSRIKANTVRRRINQPNLSLFGTAVPARFFESISARMLDDGFLGRALIVEAGDYGRRQNGGVIELPDSVLRAAEYWTAPVNFPDWTDEHPRPRTVAPDQDATAVLEQAADDFDEARNRAHAAGDIASVSIWSRAWEHASKLSLLYAISQDQTTDVISREAALWAVEFAGHHARRLIAAMHGRVAENEFHALLIKARTKLAAAPEKTLDRSTLLKNMHISARDLDQVITALYDSGQIMVVDGSPDSPNQRGARYKLVSE